MIEFRLGLSVRCRPGERHIVLTVDDFLHKKLCRVRGHFAIAGRERFGGLAVAARKISDERAHDVLIHGHKCGGDDELAWYCGYFADQKGFPTATADDIDHIREHFSVGRILVGHTIVPTITPLYDGKVIDVQVCPRRDEHGRAAIFESLLVRGKDIFRAKPDGSVEHLN